MSTPQKIVVVLALFGLAVTLLFIPFTHENVREVVSGTLPIWELGDKDAVDFRSLGIVWFCIVSTSGVLWFVFSKASKLEKVMAAAAFLLAVFCVVVVIEKSRLVPRYSVERSENKTSGIIEFTYLVKFESERYQLKSATELSRREVIQGLQDAGKLPYAMRPEGFAMTVWLEFKSKFFPDFQAQIAGPSHVAYERSQIFLNRLMNPTCAAIGSIMPWVSLLILIVGIIYWFSNRRNVTPEAFKAEESH